VTPLKLLFVCIGNTCRSPMAEAIARGLGGGRVEARSAGLMPFGRIVPGTVRALEDLGYDPAGLSSKGLGDLEAGDFDVVVSLLGEAGLAHLPASLGAETEAWAIADPYGEDDEVYLAVARELERRVRDLIDRHDRGELAIV
jgi:arsenate reductase